MNINEKTDLMYETSFHTFTRTLADKRVDYATAFAMACASYSHINDFERKFDSYWERYSGL